MPKYKSHVIHKYEPEAASVTVGEKWLVQFEPITVNTLVKTVVIEEITSESILLRTLHPGGVSSVNASRHTYFAIKFLEKVEASNGKK